MSGILYLVPNSLGPSDATDSAPLASIIPAEVQRITASLDYFIAENAKTARAFLKLVALSCPLATPLQEILISELNVNTHADTLPSLLAPIQQGRHTSLLSEAGVPAVADPGANLVRLAHANNVAVRPQDNTTTKKQTNKTS